jgi:hypothetical protein
MSNWLVKMAAKQSTQVDQFRQQVESLPFEDLADILSPNLTGNLDSLSEKVASARAEGQRLAHEQGPQLVEKAAADAAADQALVDYVSSLPDDEAIKVAHVLQHGSDVEKVAVVGAMMGALGKGMGAMRGGAAKAIGGGMGAKALGFAAKNPAAAMAIGGGAAGGLATGDVRGAAAGAGAGYGLSKMPGVANKMHTGATKSYLWAQKNMPKVASEIEALYKVAFTGDCGPMPGGGSWLNQFEGTPLLQQAIELMQHDLQLEIQNIQKRQEDAAQDTWTQRDVLSARKRLLELQLVASRNGIGEPDGDEMGGPATTAQHPEPDGDEGMMMDPGMAGMMGQAGQAQQQMMKQAAAGLGALLGAAAGGISNAHMGAGPALLGAGVGGLAGYGIGKWRDSQQDKEKKNLEAALTAAYQAGQQGGRSAPQEKQAGKASFR